MSVLKTEGQKWSVGSNPTSPSRISKPDFEWLSSTYETTPFDTLFAYFNAGVAQRKSRVLITLRSRFRNSLPVPKIIGGAAKLESRNRL